VSLLWSDHVRLGVGRDRLVLAGYQRGVHPRLVRKDIIRVQARDDARAWQAPIDALPAALAASGSTKPEVSVVLSNCFVRYALLPWNPAIRTESEWRTLAQRRLASAYGDVAEDWELRITETVRGGPLVACAVDTALLDALQAKIAEGRARLHSVQPYLIAAFNRIRRKISRESCWLVIEEPGCLVLALIQHGNWLSIRSRPVDEHWRATLSEILEGESALLALDQPCTQVVLYSPTAFGATSCNGYRLRDLTLASGTAPADQALAMALA
jgi:hypothetical protein